MLKAYNIAMEIALSGEYTLLSDILDELRINWEGTYKDTLLELRENIQWDEEEDQ